MKLDIQDIRKILPHRYPFLMVDRILECDLERRRVVGLKNLSVNEPFFQGHFPEQPVMPAVLSLEAMAQCGGILANLMGHREGRTAFFLAVDQARFRRIVIPGDQLIIEVDFLRSRLGMARFKGITRVGDEVACEAEFMFGYAPDQKD